MKKSTLSKAVLGAALVALPALAQVTPPTVPANLQVPEGNVVYLKTRAIGTQNYVCLPSPTGFAWTFHSPQATLFVSYRWLHAEIQQQMTTHFLSPNPAENGTPRPAWQSSLDTSAVWGRAAASSTDSAYVAQGAIPWLLVQIVGSRDGMNGSSMLAVTTYIHRVNTAGGVAPATGCSEAANVGATAMVPYTTDYYFYQKAKQ